MPASLLSAKIRGVRSYSPYEHKAQTIEFMPLTLIVGSNGSGKTTLIESLKFIISGEEPPLSDCRRNFIHTTRNPSNSFDKNTSYASIELLFQNARNETCLAKREISKEGLGKNVTPSISSSYKISNNPWTNVHKQDDWNKTVPQLFNLPNQAILNNVILCHQDNNLWCMGDSSSVKQIFDKIFGCEHYKKEIKYIDTEIKACKSDLIMGDKDVSHDKEKVVRMNMLINELENLKGKIDKISSETKVLDFEIQSTMEAKESIQNNILRIETKMREIDSLDKKAKELSEKDKILRKSLREPFINPQIVSDIELNERMQDHTKLVEETKNRHVQMKEREDLLKYKIKNFESQRDSLQDIINELKVTELKSRESHGTLMKNLQNIKIDQSIDEIDLIDIQISLKALDNMEQVLLQNKCNQAQLEDKLSSKQQKLSKSITNIEGIYQGLLQKIASKKVFVNKLSDQLAQADPIAKDLISVKENLEKMSSFTCQMSHSDLVTSLDTLIKESTKIIDNLVLKINNDSVTKLKTDINKENIDIGNSKSRLQTIKNQKEEFLAQQSLIEIENSKVRTASKEAHNRLVTFKNARDNILTAYMRYQDEKKFVESKNLEAKVKELQEISSKIDLVRTELDTLSSEHSNLSDCVGESFERYEEFKNNILIRDVLNQLSVINNKISLMEKKLEKNQLRNFQTNFKEIDRKFLELRDKRSMIVGSKIQIDRELVRIQTELKIYSKTNSKYAESLGKVVCNKIVMSDLEKLKECFHQSITNFHNQMIVKINEVLRARWRQIYQGSDIDHIELIDEEITKGKDKKAFNYYIAMRKDGIRMKMREKSSAGQKALASIILRMTLAELFVKDFAFIALDEPTANLDLANVQSLAKAIGSYVKKRTKKGVNIQWIIITHDEQFLKALDAECSPYYYKIQLDSEGCSKIVKISYQGISGNSISNSLEST